MMGNMEVFVLFTVTFSTLRAVQLKWESLLHGSLLSKFEMCKRQRCISAEVSMPARHQTAKRVQHWQVNMVENLAANENVYFFRTGGEQSRAKRSGPTDTGCLGPTLAGIVHLWYPLNAVIKYLWQRHGMEAGYLICYQNFFSKLKSSE